MLPTLKNYEKLRDAFNASGGNFLARPYEELRTQYEELRRPFNVTAQDQYTDVWTYPTVPHRKGKHPCEKPADMARDIVRISSRPNDVVLVFFSGSGVFASEALKQGRRVIAVEMDPHWASVTLGKCVSAVAESEQHTPSVPKPINEQPRAQAVKPIKHASMRGNAVTNKQLSIFDIVAA